MVAGALQDGPWRLDQHANTTAHERYADTGLTAINAHAAIAVARGAAAMANAAAQEHLLLTYAQSTAELPCCWACC